MKWMTILAIVLAGCAGANHKSSSTTATTTTAPAAKTATATTPAATDKQDATGKVTCTKDKETRALEVIKKDAGCSLEYTKAGSTKSVATSAHGSQHCNESLKKTRGKLEAGGFKCAP